MNRIGLTLSRDWLLWRPADYAQLPDPEAAFAAMGEQAAAEIEQRIDQALAARPTTRSGRAAERYRITKASADLAALREAGQYLIGEAADKQAAFVPGISDTGEAFPTKPAPTEPAGENEQGGPDHT